VKKKTEITELISAYSDNELTGTDKQTVEEHLAACESYSALLEIYREISISADESNVPVPDALRIGVMNRIRSESFSAEKEVKKKKWWQHQILLTRLAPIAACLAVVLLVWQFGGNMFGMNETSAPVAAPAPMADAPAAAPPAPAAEPAPAPESAILDNLWNADDAAESILPSEGAGGLGGDDSMLHDSIPELSLVPGIHRHDEETEDAHLQRVFSDFIDNAYAVITITGELPAFLAEFEPLAIDNWQGWELVYEIPSTDVDDLMLELLNRRSSLVRNHDNQNSTYAIVFFSRS